MEELENLVYFALGQAAMCWTEIPTSSFDMAAARRIGETLMEAIKAHEQKVLLQEKAAWHLMHPHIIRDKQGAIIAQSRNFGGDEPA